MAAALMFLSSAIFVSMGEPPRSEADQVISTFAAYLREGRKVFRTDDRFRLFVYAQWCGGGILMAMPFYVVQAGDLGFDLQRVAILLGAQTAGALASNVLWGWWGDRYGKESLLRGITAGRIVPPIAVVILTFTSAWGESQILIVLAGIFVLLGALANGLTIAVIGFLMEISPENRRPAYSGYFNALTAPAYLLPLLAGIIADSIGLSTVFLMSGIAAAMQLAIVNHLWRAPSRG
jgi:MFS family permease